MAPASAPGPRELIAPAPLFVRVTRVVLPVTLLVTRRVFAHWSPRCTEVLPQLP
jgi:hypothetical protein